MNLLVAWDDNGNECWVETGIDLQEGCIGSMAEMKVDLNLLEENQRMFQQAVEDNSRLH